LKYFVQALLFTSVLDEEKPPPIIIQIHFTHGDKGRDKMFRKTRGFKGFFDFLLVKLYFENPR